jgi:hypothetical protein
MIKELCIEIECDRNYCGSHCPFANLNCMCKLFNQERIKNTGLSTLGEFYRLEICRKLSGDGR